MRIQALSAIGAAGIALALPASATAQGPVIDPIPTRPPAPVTTHVLVGPRTIGTHTDVLLRFRQPLTTGVTASERSIETLVISGPPRAECIGPQRIVLGAAQQGTAMRRRLRPRRLGGSWCAGVYRGRLIYQSEPACGPGPVQAKFVACPMFMMAPVTLATFHFRVTSR